MSGAQSTVVDVDKLERDAVFEARERNLEDRVPVEQITDQLLPNSYTEIKTLLWIKSPSTCPVYKEALQEWQRKTKLLTSKVERRTKQSESLKSEIYNLVGYFSVFQGVVLTAVSQAQTSVLNCSKASVPILLSALASAVCFVGIWQKQQLIHSLEKTIECDTLALQELERRDSSLRREGPDFKFANFRENKVKKSTKNAARGWSIKFVPVFISVAMDFFAVAFPVSHWFLLCRHS